MSATPTFSNIVSRCSQEIDVKRMEWPTPRSR
jgi:hypothetical protein